MGVHGGICDCRQCLDAVLDPSHPPTVFASLDGTRLEKHSPPEIVVRLQQLEEWQKADLFPGSFGRVGWI